MARVSIEDCLERLPNRFALVVVAANRVRQLMGNSIPLIKTKNKDSVIALREIAEGKVTMSGNVGESLEYLQEIDPEAFAERIRLENEERELTEAASENPEEDRTDPAST